MDKFTEVYRSLNNEQKLAVDTIDGPLLVIAGPGTGKTQLLSARVANILTKTDTPARNILCLTFTENGADNMRDRLSSFIGQAAYDVTISTYHAFGGDLIQRFPEYFSQYRLQNSIDELEQRQIISKIVESLSYANPLKQTQHHLNDLLDTISEVKRALLDTNDLRAIAEENLDYLKKASDEISRSLSEYLRIPTFQKALPIFEKILTILIRHQPKSPVNRRYGSTAQIAINNLETALQSATETKKTTALTNWKDNWLIKNAKNQFILGGEVENKRLKALADVIDQYSDVLERRGLYDFDDMILRAIDVLAKNDDLKFSLQEQYLYILLDEFQDTNPAQFKIVQLLTDNPVNEGRPNVMAVGDDDQAIYTFQGALYSNMMDFYHLYQKVKVINLTSNYRSHPALLETALNVASQINERLHTQIPGIQKVLTAAKFNSDTKVTIHREEFLSDIAQSEWIANSIKKLISSGTQPREIAVLAPRHRQLEPLVPYLNKLDIPVRYEKRENILESPVVKQLITMSKLVIALSKNDDALTNNLWPTVLSYEFWQIPVSDIWQIAWQVADSAKYHSSSGKTGIINWSQALLKNKTFRKPALLFLGIANQVEQETCETILDYLIGTIAVTTNETDLPSISSPLRQFYTNAQTQDQQPQLFYETLSHLKVLRTKLRRHQATIDDAMKISDLIDFVDMYTAANERMINTSPYNQQANAVQIMTVFKAKGLEFGHVFLPNCQNDVWGSSSHGQVNRLTLPANLIPIRYAGANDDERLRILYVAITRAKMGLYLTSVAQDFDGQITKHLKYFDEREEVDKTVKDYILPANYQIVQKHDLIAPGLELMELDWQQRHAIDLQPADLKSLLENRLINYCLSPTHLNHYLDLIYGGPQSFYFRTILRFPEAPTTDIQFGIAIHETLEWLQYYVNQNQKLPNLELVFKQFIIRIKNKKLSDQQTEQEIERGTAALKIFFSKRKTIFKPSDKAEVNFKFDNVLIGDVRLTGKIDRLEIDKINKVITVVDFKTGKSYNHWLSDPKLHAHKRQLYCYKLLIEKSKRFAGYSVNQGRIEFIEPNKNKQIDTLTLDFTDNELTRDIKLLSSVWNHIKALKFPNVQQYPANLSGIRQFENDLIESKI